jgi:hypothetical protein
MDLIRMAMDLVYEKINKNYRIWVGANRFWVRDEGL